MRVQSSDTRLQGIASGSKNTYCLVFCSVCIIKRMWNNVPTCIALHRVPQTLPSYDTMNAVIVELQYVNTSGKNGTWATVLSIACDSCLTEIESQDKSLRSTKCIGLPSNSGHTFIGLAWYLVASYKRCLGRKVNTMSCISIEICQTVSAKKSTK